MNQSATAKNESSDNIEVENAALQDDIV